MNSLSVIRNIILIFGLILVLLPAAASSDSADNTIRFIIVGDRTGGHEPGVYPRVLEQAARLEPEFLITVGDMIEGYTSDSVQLATEWQEIMRFFSPVTVPVYYTPGNHDITYDGMLPAYKEYIGEPYYSTDYKSLHLIVLDNSRWSSSEELPSEQLDWLENDLKTNQTSKTTMVFMHKPFWYSTVALGKADTLHSLFKAYDVSAVFCGHFHTYFSGLYDDIKYTNIGSSGGSVGGRPGEIGYQFAYVTVTGSDISIVPIKADAILAWDIVGVEDIIRSTIISHKGIEFVAGAAVTSELQVPGSVVQIQVTNYSDSLTLDDTLKWTVPEGWKVEPMTSPISIKPGENKKVSFQISSSGNLYPVPELNLVFPYSESEPQTVSKALDITRSAPCVEKTPAVDGVISSGEWTEAVTELFSANGEKTECDPVEFYFAYDKENLYLGAKCTESKIDSIVATVTEHDGGVYTEDCVGYFFQPDIEQDTVYQIYINPLGTVFDQIIWQKEDGYFISNKSWNGNYQIATSKGDGYWSVEARIPLAQFGIEASSGDTWRMNFRRKQKRLDKTANWQAPIAYDPESFGLLKFK